VSSLNECRCAKIVNFDFCLGVINKTMFYLAFVFLCVFLSSVSSFM